MAKLLTIRKNLHRLLAIFSLSFGPVVMSAVTTAVFLRSYYKYKYRPQYYYLYTMLGESLCWSRGSATVLCVSCCFVILPMCRNVLSFVRNSSKDIGRFFGRLLDKNIWFHQACAVIIIVSAGIHIAAHFVNATRFSTNYSSKFKDINFASYHNQNPMEFVFTSVAGLTGIAMTLVLLAMVLTSVTAVRQASYEMFWYSHHLFIVFFLLLFVHGLGGIIKHQVNLDTHSPGCDSIQTNRSNIVNTSQVAWCSEAPKFKADEPEAWMWCIGPLFFYTMERLIRAIRSFQKVKITKIIDHDDGVLEIQMQKENFTAAPGQYVFVNCQDVSRFEWHPFTLTLCPSTEDSTFSIHCKILGDWTERFSHRLLQKLSQEDQRQLTSEVHHGRNFSDITPKVKIVVDGPYGSPFRDVWSYHVSVCIATGIGVTPFAAVLNDLRWKVKSRSSLKLRRLYFVLVCRRIKSFHWFVELLHSIHVMLREANRPDLLICNFYYTGPQFQREVYTKQYERWLTSRLHQNRPSWKELFDKVSKENPR